MSASGKEEHISCVETYEVKIFVGRKVIESGFLVPLWEIEDAINDFVNTRKICVSVLENKYHYVGGSEPGVVVTLINYARFPKEPKEIWDTAVDLARLLKKVAKQRRVTVQSHAWSLMIGNPED